MGDNQIGKEMFIEIPSTLKSDIEFNIESNAGFLCEKDIIQKQVI